MEKAYWVTSIYADNNEGDIFFAETPGKAKQMACLYTGDDYIDMRAYRRPQADVWVSQGSVPMAWGLQNGIYGWIECSGSSYPCSQQLYGDEDTYFYEGEAYCLKCLTNKYLNGIYPAGTHCLWSKWNPYKDEDIFCYEPVEINGEVL
jgi:hypothetical protein